MSDGMPQGVQVTAAVPADQERILGRDALAFVAALQRTFAGRRREILESRKRRRAGLAAGGTLDFVPETAAIRNGEWSVAEAPADLVDRRVEITGPAERKMLINALNSGARVF